MKEITVVGGGLAGLVAAIECAEGGGRVRLLEAGRELGGRARTLDGPFRANLGAHVIYADGPSIASRSGGRGSQASAPSEASRRRNAQ